MSRELPNGWLCVELGDIASFEMGQAPPGAASNFDGLGTPFVKAGEFGRVRPVVREWTTQPLKFARRSDVLICVVGATAGKLNLGEDCAIGRSVAAIRPHDPSLQKIIYLQLLARVSELRAASTGSAQGVISKAMLAGLDVLVPPSAECQRIADKLDAMLARIDACRERLDLASTLLKRFRQSVLSSAVNGKLCGEASSWQLRRADQVCAKVQSGGTPKDGFSDHGVPFLKVYNIVDQKIDFDNRPQYVTAAQHAGALSKSRVLPGDVLMNIVGPPLLKVAQVPSGSCEWNINQAITLFRPSPEISSEWLYLVLCEGRQVREVMRDTKGSVGQVNISLSQCRAFLLPVPPPAEQAEIVAKTKRLLAVANKLEERLSTLRTTSGRLAPATLAKAFRGELVPQEPTDEPADALLARLRAGDVDTPAPNRRRGRPSAA